MVTKTSDNQIGKFKAASRDLECDEDEARWDDTLKKVTKAPLKKANVPPQISFTDPEFFKVAGSNPAVSTILGDVAELVEHETVIGTAALGLSGLS